MEFSVEHPQLEYAPGRLALGRRRCSQFKNANSSGLALADSLYYAHCKPRHSLGARRPIQLSMKQQLHPEAELFQLRQEFRRKAEEYNGLRKFYRPHRDSPPPSQAGPYCSFTPQPAGKPSKPASTYFQTMATPALPLAFKQPYFPKTNPKQYASNPITGNHQSLLDRRWLEFR